MTSKGFVVAMRAEVSPAPHDRPFLRASPGHPEWLIVARWGPRGEYLTIGTAGAAGAPATTEAAPIGLQPQRTWLGLLAEEEPDGGGSLFLLLRDLPAAVPVAGAFAPAEGFARLRPTSGGPRLTVVGRDVATIGTGNGGAVPEAPGAWVIAAQRCPWAGEFLDEGGAGA